MAETLAQSSEIKKLFIEEFIDGSGSVAVHHKKSSGISF